MKERASSPAATGPSGPLFEGQVGAHYLLSMLAGAEPRGLPGTSIEHVAFQRAAEGRALDDIVVHARERVSGEPAVLELQVKRTITFAPRDDQFRSVVNQVAEASRRPDFRSTRYELAIAIARTSTKTTGPYQDVLTWARQLDDPETFIARIRRPGSANDDMRTFVNTFRSHLSDAGAPHDTATLWHLLRRFQILLFDFTAVGSASKALAIERAVRILHPESISQAPSLWSSLSGISLEVAVSGGQRDLPTLLTELRRQSFRFAGERRYNSARTTLVEASRSALGDIRDSVAGVMLTRHQYVSAVHEALENSRFVEIRGDVGVGKSGVLKHFANQINTEGTAVVLSPSRIPPGGWMAMRNVIGFDGTAQQLLSDLASTGATVLFVDNLDSFTAGEEKTVIDLIVAAANVPGVAVIVTARRRFGFDQPDWLPSDALGTLGRAEPIFIQELSDSEIDEIRYAAPALAPLLRDTGPARDIVRNLFHLDFQASHDPLSPIPTTEIGMAERWWRTGGARPGRHERERRRLLKFLAREALADGSVDVSGQASNVVDMLVEDETLRDLGDDRIMFRHDVLREWAIANLLYSDPSLINDIALGQRASATLARSVELVARMKLTHAVDSNDWKALLDETGREDVHDSWRRAVLLSLVRPVDASDLLTSASDHLLADGGDSLRELILYTMAVDGQPISRAMQARGQGFPEGTGGIVIPAAPSWYQLVHWLLNLVGDPPRAAFPHIVDFYVSWSFGMYGRDPLAPRIAKQVYRWLVDMERIHFPPASFDRLMERDHRALKSQLRILFLFLSDQTPALAADYIRSLQRGRHNDDLIRQVIRSPGSLAKAAPDELAELVMNALIPQERSSGKPDPSPLRGPFTWVQYEYVPASPAQRPFFDLLTSAPQAGLSLIHQLVDHAHAFYERRYGAADERVSINLGSKLRAFTAFYSYSWSRPDSGDPCVASALMALEAWGHSRVERGEDFANVLRDMVGSESLAAYLLVAVDLIISHWPESQEVAIPFLASPELLCIDRQRWIHDTMEFPDILGLKEMQMEPLGRVGIRSLTSRASRRRELYYLLRHYALGPENLRGTLVSLLQEAGNRLGPPEERSDLGDPRFMALHALNIVDPGNWHRQDVQMSDGTRTVDHVYVSPESERRHLAPMQEAATSARAQLDMERDIAIAIDDPSRSSAEFAASAVAWARKASRQTENEEVDLGVAQAIVGAAMVIMRDGDEASRAKHRAWACRVFDQARGEVRESVFRVRAGLRFNPIAVAFVGRVYVLKDDVSSTNVGGLLQLVAKHPAAAAHGWRLAAATLAVIDGQLPRAVLRCAFRACIRATQNLHQPEQKGAVSAALQRRLQSALEDEIACFFARGVEPDWPRLPRETVTVRRSVLLGEERGHLAPRPPERFDHQKASLWLRGIEGMRDIQGATWVGEIAQCYAEWTGLANGAGLDVRERIEHLPREWNRGYFGLLAHCLVDRELQAPIAELTVETVTSLPDASFLHVITVVLRSVDEVCFHDGNPCESVDLRSRLAHRLMKTLEWDLLVGEESTSIARDTGRAVARFFFNDLPWDGPATCYLRPRGIDRLDGFLPVLEEVVASCPSSFVASVLLNLLEVSPRQTHLPVLVSATKVWMDRFPSSTRFWVDQYVGHRVCTLVEEMCRREPGDRYTDGDRDYLVGQLFPKLVSMGVSEAAHLEHEFGDIDA